MYDKRKKTYYYIIANTRVLFEIKKEPRHFFCVRPVIAGNYYNNICLGKPNICK